MDGDVPPRAFVSHASEDKERFVLPFAEALRAHGVDAWVDRWEIRSGDSLVQMIFDEGIAGADAFIIVLSSSSVRKPWVREELDAAVVRRIESDGERRVMPVVLDDDVEVPAPLRHLLWESVPRDGLEGVTRRVVDTLFRRDVRPPLGAPPAYVATSAPWTGVPADDTVLALLVDLWRDLTPNHTAFSNPVEEAAAAKGIGSEQFHESMHALVRQGLVDAQLMAGGLRWWLRPLPDRVWLRVEAGAGVDIEAIRRRLLSLIVNEEVSRLDPVELGLHPFTVRALLRGMAAEGLSTLHEIADGTFSVAGVTPLARRTLRA
jgi:hypothetical protein